MLTQSGNQNFKGRMSTTPALIGVSRRALFRTLSGGALCLFGSGLATRSARGASEESQAAENEFIQRIVGKEAAQSSRVGLEMPRVFSNGSGVPLKLLVGSPMTEADHVMKVHILAPKNPLPIIAVFQFTPQSGRAAVSTRVRLAEPQYVLAVAQMSDGACFMARTFVEVTENGCPNH